MSTRTELLRLLADGGFHSGTDLGQALGISRAAVCKSLAKLDELGFAIHRVSGRGYRLINPTSPLDVAQIQSALRARHVQVEVFEEIDSTSQYLLRTAAAASTTARACLAESQTQGRGRRGRHWFSTPYQNILLSMAWHLDDGPSAAAGLSLAAGVAVMRTLLALGANDLGLKWPNDILWQGRKLAGLLTDLRGEADGPCTVVVGLGLNIWIAERDAVQIDQHWAGLSQVLDSYIDRNALAVALIDALHDMFQQFSEHGFEAFRREWEQYHCYAGQAVSVVQGETRIDGDVHGIDAHGALLLRDARGHIHALHAGDVSLRLRA